MLGTVCPYSIRSKRRSDSDASCRPSPTSRVRPPGEDGASNWRFAEGQIMNATRYPPAPGEGMRRRRLRGQVSAISIPGTYRWRLDEAIVEAFLDGESAPPGGSETHALSVAP